MNFPTFALICFAFATLGNQQQLNLACNKPDCNREARGAVEVACGSGGCDGNIAGERVEVACSKPSCLREARGAGEEVACNSGGCRDFIAGEGVEVACNRPAGCIRLARAAVA